MVPTPTVRMSLGARARAQQRNSAAEKAVSGRSGESEIFADAAAVGLERGFTAGPFREEPNHRGTNGRDTDPVNVVAAHRWV